MESIKNEINSPPKYQIKSPLESQNNQWPRKLNALIIGGSGAVGREIIDILVKSSFYNLITIPTRRVIPKWESYSEEEKRKLDIFQVNSLDDILTPEKFEEIKDRYFSKNKDYDTVFCCLGSRVKEGEAQFRKVDFEYVVNAAKLANYLKIPHYSIVSSKGASPSSWFLYLKVKGQADVEILKENVECISIFRPGLIKDRDNDSRIGEKIFKYLPFLDKLTSRDLALALVKEDMLVHEKNIKQRKIYIHSDIEELTDSKTTCC